MIKIFKIKGDSLYPLFKNGQLVLGIHPFFEIKQEDIIVFNHEKYGKMIKKIKEIKEDKIFVEGTQPNSIDSRDFGFIFKKSITHKIIFTIKKINLTLLV